MQVLLYIVMMLPSAGALSARFDAQWFGPHSGEPSLRSDRRSTWKAVQLWRAEGCEHCGAKGH